MIANARAAQSEVDSESAAKDRGSGGEDFYRHSNAIRPRSCSDRPEAEAERAEDFAGRSAVASRAAPQEEADRSHSLDSAHRIAGIASSSSRPAAWLVPARRRWSGVH